MMVAGVYGVFMSSYHFKWPGFIQDYSNIRQLKIQRVILKSYWSNFDFDEEVTTRAEHEWVTSTETVFTEQQCDDKWWCLLEVCLVRDCLPGSRTVYSWDIMYVYYAGLNHTWDPHYLFQFPWLILGNGSSCRVEQLELSNCLVTSHFLAQCINYVLGSVSF